MAATEPAVPADKAVTNPVSSKVPVDTPFLFRYICMLLRRNSNIGNCMAVKGKLRPASAVYPLHNCAGLLNFLSAVMVALPSNALLFVFSIDDVDENFRTICAFCFRTSAGVRIRQETSSATEEARACTMGTGRSGLLEGRVGLVLWRNNFVAS